MSDFRAEGPLCLLVLTYVKPLDQVDAKMAEHVKWLHRGFAEGVFLIAGRQKPRAGGVIVARGEKPEALALARTDPFVVGGVATVEVIAFNASFASPDMAALLA